MLKAYINKMGVAAKIVAAAAWFGIASFGAGSVLALEQTEPEQLLILAKNNKNITPLVATEQAALDFQLGKHYKKVADRILAKAEIKRFVEADNSKTKVAMFFSYACYWCSQLNQPLDSFALRHKKNIKTQMFPVAFNKTWLLLAKGYFTAQALDPKGKIDEEIFKAIHTQGLHLWEEKALEEFFVSKGISKEKFKATFNSFDVDTKVKLADELSIAFEIDATPNIIIAGKKGAYITNLVMTKDKDVLFAVVEYLTKKVGG